jgi:glucokinase
MFADLAAARIDRGAGHAAIGVDVGGTKVAIGLLDAASLTLLDRTEIPTRPDRGGAAVLRDTAAEVVGLAVRAGRAGRQVLGVGVAVPEIVDLSGRITSSAVIHGWNELPVSEVLGAAGPVRIEADVRAAAFAEAVLGAGRWAYHLYLTIGTGISYCAVYQGRPVAGAYGGALNIGTSVLADLPGHGSGRQQVVLEDLASGAALVRRYQAGGGTARRAEEVFAAAAHGDPAATALVDDAARTLGTGIALLVNVLDPEAVVVGGGLGSADSGYFSSAVSWARQYMYSDTARAIPITHAELGADAGVIGAALVGLLAPVPDGQAAASGSAPAPPATGRGRGR